MSSCSGIGLSSSSTSIFSGGLCSGNTRRPSMFTAKYRLREERKKILKLSLNKVRRIEDPESFLRRSVLINNTVKRLQREVRDEKMLRNGGYASKLSSMHSFRKSFASSRLQELVHADDLIDDNSSLCNSSHYAPQPLIRHQMHNARKRPLVEQSDSDVEEVLSQIYIPPTPCIISAIEDEDPSTTPSPLACLSTPDGEIKKPRMSLDEEETEPEKVLLPMDFRPSSSVVHNGIELDQLEIDVDVVGEGDGETNEWATNSRAETLSVETVDEVMDEFRLDFHLTSPSVTLDGNDEPEPQVRNVSELKSSSDETKENTCDSVSSHVSPCCPGLNLPLTDHPAHQKCPNSVNSVGNPESNSSPEKQFSSCGHSSIFGELQSVVFHNLIASLET